MAKFCGNCGAPIDENTKICGQCGIPVDDDPKISHIKIIDPKKQKRNKKMFKYFSAFVLAVAVVVVAINVISQFTGYNGLIRKVMATYEKYDIDTLLSLSSDIYYYGQDNDAEYYFENVVGTALDSFETSVGHDYQMSYSVNDVYEMSERRKEETLEEIEYTYKDFDVSIIEKILVFDITVTASKGSKSVNKELDVTVSKEDGTWKLLYME